MIIYGTKQPMTTETPILNDHNIPLHNRELTYYKSIDITIIPSKSIYNLWFSKYHIMDIIRYDIQNISKQTGDNIYQ